MDQQSSITPSATEKLSNSQVKKQLFWTNGCYRAALLEHFDSKLTKKWKKLDIKELKDLLWDKWKINHENMPPQVHEGYMKRLLALESNKLSLIVRAYQTGQQFRKQETIDAIMTELFERASRIEEKT